MRIFRANLLFFIFLFCFNPKAQAQVYEDAGMWSTFSLEHEFNSKFSAIIDEEFRLKENFSRLNLFYTNVGVTYKLFKTFKVGIIYRNIQKLRDDNSFSSRNRLMLDMTFKFKKGQILLSYRHRLQGEVRNVYSSKNGKYPEYYSRNKFEIKYDPGKTLLPYTSIELRYQIIDPRNPESDGKWHRARYVMGMDYKINNNNSLGVYYLIQREWDILEPEALYIIGLEYSLTI